MIGASSLPARAVRETVQRSTHNSKVEFTIPEAMVGYVIGRRGNRIRKIEEETGTRVRFKERIGTGDKVII